MSALEDAEGIEPIQMTRFKRPPQAPAGYASEIGTSRWGRTTIARLSTACSGPLSYGSMVGWRGFDPLPRRERIYSPHAEAIGFAFPRWSLAPVLIRAITHTKGEHRPLCEALAERWVIETHTLRCRPLSRRRRPPDRLHAPRWRKGKESNPQPFGATVFKTVCRTIPADPSEARWYPRSDSNGHCLVPKTSASYQLGY